MAQSKRRSYSYQTGVDDLDPAEAQSPSGFTRYAKAKLGCEIPVGAGRTGWYARLKEEMEMQGWSWDDLITTVRYLADRQIVVRKIYGIFYFVHEAQVWARDRAVQDLHAKVAEAMSVEEDERWLQRLRLAKGKALERVYVEWRNAHEV